MALFKGSYEQVRARVPIIIMIFILLGFAIPSYIHNTVWIYDYEPLFWHNDYVGLDEIEQCDVYYYGSYDYLQSYGDPNDIERSDMYPYGRGRFVSPSVKGGWAVYFTYGCRRNRAGHYQISVIDWDGSSCCMGLWHCWSRVRYEDYQFFLDEATLRRER